MKRSFKTTITMILGSLILASTVYAANPGVQTKNISKGIQQGVQMETIKQKKDTKLDQRRLICGGIKKEMQAEKAKWLSLNRQASATFDRINEMIRNGDDKGMIELQRTLYDGYQRDISASVQRQREISARARNSNCIPIWDSL